MVTLQHFLGNKSVRLSMRRVVVSNGRDVECEFKEYLILIDVIISCTIIMIWLFNYVLTKKKLFREIPPLRVLGGLHTLSQGWKLICFDDRKLKKSKLYSLHPHFISDERSKIFLITLQKRVPHHNLDWKVVPNQFSSSVKTLKTIHFTTNVSVRLSFLEKGFGFN